MKKYLILSGVFILVVISLFATSAFAMDNMPNPGSAEFGQHIASMTPEHPRMMGAMFGDMISNMARDMPCH